MNEWVVYILSLCFTLWEVKVLYDFYRYGKPIPVYRGRASAYMAFAAVFMPIVFIALTCNYVLVFIGFVR